MELIKGKWYKCKVYGSNLTKYILFKIIKSDHLGGDYTYENYFNINGGWHSSDIKSFEFANINEIKHLLPKDYKFEEEYYEIY